MATAAEDDGGFHARPNFKASIEEPCQTNAVHQQRSIDRRVPGSSDHLVGVAAAATKSVGDCDEERTRSMSDIIAEAMRENGVQQEHQRRRVEIVNNESDWPRKSTSTAGAAVAAEASAPVVPSSLSPPPHSSPLSPASAVSMKTTRLEATDEVTDFRALHREALVAAPSAAGKIPFAGAASDSDMDQAASLVLQATPRSESEMGVIQAMAEAILDESYMAPETSKHLGTATTAATAAAGSINLNAKASADMSVQPIGEDVSGEASPNFQEISNAVTDTVRCSREAPRSKIVETKPGGENSPVSNRGVDAPFGHAVIIEEHVSAVSETSRRNEVGRRLDLRVGQNGSQTSAMVNGWRRPGGKAKTSLASAAGPGYNNSTAGGSCDESQGTSKTCQTAASATSHTPLAAAPAAAAKIAAGDHRTGWGSVNVAGGGEGFLVLQGGMSSLNTLASLAAKAGMVARANMSSRGGIGAAGREPPKRPSPGTCTPEEYVLLQEEREAEEADSKRGDGAVVEGERLVLATVARDNVRDFQAAVKPESIRGGGCMLGPRDSLVVQASVTAAVAVTEEEEGAGGGAQAAEIEDPARVFFYDKNDVTVDVEGKGRGRDEGACAASADRDRNGSSEAGSGWGHVDGNGCLEDVDDDEEEGREENVELNDGSDPPAVTNGTPKAVIGVESSSNRRRRAGKTQNFAPQGAGRGTTPQPKSEKIDQLELLMVGKVNKSESLDGLPEKRSLYVNGTPVRYPLRGKVDAEGKQGGQGACADSGATAGENLSGSSLGNPVAYPASARSTVDAAATDDNDDESEGEVSKPPQGFDLEDGVADEGIVDFERAELPEPSLDNDALPPRSVENAGPVNAREGVAEEAGEMGGETVASNSCGNSYRSSREGSEPVASVRIAPKPQVAGSLLLTRSAGHAGTGTLVAAVAEAVGARAAAPQELLGHFVRAGGGNVAKAASLYRAVADEFVELRDMARRRRNASSTYAGGVPTESTPLLVTPLVSVTSLIPAGKLAGAGEPEPSATAAADGGAGQRKEGVFTKPRCESSFSSAASNQEAPRRPPQQALDADFPFFEADPRDIEKGRAEYSVTISSQKLGMTVENVLERTVVRAAAPGGGAEAAGVGTGSLLVALDGQSTKNASHFEVIELLRIANRPLTLRLRRVARERLLSRRTEMRALTRPYGVIAPGGAVGGTMTHDQATAAAERSSHPKARHLSPPPPPPPRGLHRQDSGHLARPALPSSDSVDVGADGRKGETHAAVTASRTPETPVAGSNGSGAFTASGASDTFVLNATREQTVSALSVPAVGFTAGNWEAVEWAESCLLKILRLFCVGEEVRATEEEKAAVNAAAQAVAEAKAAAAASSVSRLRGNAGRSSRADGVSNSTEAKAGRETPTISSDERSPLNDGFIVGVEEAWGDGQPLLQREGASTMSADPNDKESVRREDEEVEDLGVWRATEAEEAEASRAHSEYIRREESHKAIVQLLLEFSGMLERDWSRTRRQDHPQGAKNADGSGNLGGVAAAAAAAACSAGGRIENMGALLEQLAPLIDWDCEAVAAVGPELRELLCVLLDADLNFDLSSAKFPRLVGGGVAAMLQELLMHLPTEQAVLEAPPLAHRLALSNSVCARGACCALVATTYSLPPLPGQLQFRGILSRLLHDRMSGVRGEAVKALAHVAPMADASTCRWLMLLAERASHDQDLSVRRASVDSLVQIGHRLLGVLDDQGIDHGKMATTAKRNSTNKRKGNGNIDDAAGKAAGGQEESEVARGVASRMRREIHSLRGKLLPIISRLTVDNEWQVRVEVACRMDFVCVALGEQCSAVTADIFPLLLKDADADVRCEAIRCLPRLARILLGFAMSGYAIAAADDPSPSAETVPESSADQNTVGLASTLASDIPPGHTSSGDGGGATPRQPLVETCSGPSSLPRWKKEAVEVTESREVEACALASVGWEDGQVERDGAGLSAGASSPRGAERSGDEAEPQEPVQESVLGMNGGSSLRKEHEPDGGSPREPKPEFEAQAKAGIVSGGKDGSGKDHVVGCGGFSVSDDDVGNGDVRDEDRTERVEIGVAGEKARRDILDTLMPAASLLMDDPTAEVRGTVAVSLGEVLRLMVGFEDYVAALDSTRGRGVDVDVGADESDGVALDARDRRSATGAMVTCCCVTGEDEMSSSGSGRKRVCHGKLLREAEEAAADAMAEAAMTAELIDLAGFEPVGDGEVDPSGNGDSISEESGESGASEAFPVEMEEDVDAHVSVLLRSDGPPGLVNTEAIVDASSVEDSDGFSRPSGGDGCAVAVGEAVEANSPGLADADENEADGADGGCAPAAENQHGESYETGHDHLDAVIYEAESKENSKDVAAGDSNESHSGETAIDLYLNDGDSLVSLVRRLLLDSDANVACTMLQALRPAWGSELGPGPGPEHGPLRAAVEPVLAAASGGGCVDECQPPRILEAGRGNVGSSGELRGEGRRGAGAGDGTLASPIRGCMLTLAQVGCVLPALAELFGNPSWRVRAAVAEALPALVACTLCDRLKADVINLSRRMLFDRVDAVRRSAAEQLVMAARIDLDRCPARPLHHIPGACARETHLPSLRRRQPSPVPAAAASPKLNTYSGADSVTDLVEHVINLDGAAPRVKKGKGSCLKATPPQGLENGDRSAVEYRLDAKTCDEVPLRAEGAEGPLGGGREFGEGEAGACPKDRGSACGLWLRLVMVPLMRECLEASYRSKLLVLHMTQAAFRVGVTTPAVMSSVVVPVLLRGLADTVPNVRLTAARVADDILSVAAMSSWPAPDGRSGDAYKSSRNIEEEDDGSGVAEDKGEGFTASGSLSREAPASTSLEAVAARSGSKSGDGNRAGGAWWDCGWKEVELRLEALSERDQDRDVAYFAAQALKPKWEGDVWRTS